MTVWSVDMVSYGNGVSNYMVKYSEKDDNKSFSEMKNESEAYQKLIAAAPDLLDALEKLARLGNGDEYGNSTGNLIARAAIAKATGTPQ